MKKTNRVPGKTMSDIAFHLDEVRSCARALVRKNEYQCGSRMLAYERVGQMIGMSGMWVRKLIHGYGDVRLLYVTTMNLKAAYDRTCLAVERRAQELEEANAASTRALATAESDLEAETPAILTE